MCVMQTPARWNMVSQTRYPCSASCNLITVASDEATFPAKERGLSCLMRPWPTSVFAGPDPSVTGCHLPDPTLSCAGRKGRGARVGYQGTPCVTGTKNPWISSCFLLMSLFLQKIPEMSLWFNLHPLSLFSVLFRSLNVCVSPGHCPKRGLDLFWSLSLPTCSVLTYEARSDAPLRWPLGKRDRPQGEVCLGPTSSFHIP